MLHGLKYRDLRVGWALLGLVACARAGGSGGHAGAMGSAGAGGDVGGETGSGVAGAGGDTNAAGGAQSSGGSQSQAGTGGTPSSAGGAGGTAAGGASAGGAAGTAAGSCAGGAIACDDFETYADVRMMGPWKVTTTGGGLAALDPTHAWSGKQAVKMTMPAGSGRRAQIFRSGAPVFPMQPNAFWGRMMLRVAGLPDKTVHYDIVQGDGNGAGQYRIGGMGNILFNYEPHDCYYGAPTPIPQDRWICWEWLFDGTTNTLELYIDGGMRGRVVNMGQGCVDGTKSVWAAPIFQTARMGWINYQATAATVEMWIDDVALGSKRIGCPTSDTAH